MADLEEKYTDLLVENEELSKQVAVMRGALENIAWITEGEFTREAWDNLGAYARRSARSPSETADG